MNRTYGGWAVSSLRTTTRIELISDWIRTRHRRDRSTANRMGRNWNRWHDSAAYIIGTSGKRPREHAVNIAGHRNVDHYRCVRRSRSRVAHRISRRSRTNRSSGARSLQPTLTRRYVKLTSGLHPKEFLAGLRRIRPAGRETVQPKAHDGSS